MVLLIGHEGTGHKMVREVLQDAIDAGTVDYKRVIESCFLAERFAYDFPKPFPFMLVSAGLRDRHH